MLADFDQGKDVREAKLAVMTEEKISEEDLNSVKSQNTIKAGTTGYQTANYNKDSQYDMSDEFYAIGVTLLHLVLTFPGEPKNRNHYAKTFTMSDTNDVAPLFDNWANKFVKNKHPEFTFAAFKSILELAMRLLSKKIISHAEVKEIVNNL